MVCKTRSLDSRTQNIIMTTKTITDQTGIVGFLTEIQLQPDSVLVFQLPRETRMLSNIYVETALDSIKAALPPGKIAMVIGADVNIYELAGPDAVSLKLKGII